MEKKLQKNLAYYILLLKQDLWQAHYQIYQIFLKEFIELNVNTDMMIKKVKLAELDYKYRDFFLEYKNFKDNLIEHKCCNKIYQQRFDEKLKERFFNTYKFSNHGNNKFIFFVAKRCLSL